MKTISVTEFKTHCLKLIDELSRTGEPIEVTKRSKVVAIVNPPVKAATDWTPGKCAHLIDGEIGDVISPVMDIEEWDLESKWF